MQNITSVKALVPGLLFVGLLSQFAHAQCVKFDGLPPTTVWGTPAGHASGDLVHTENGISVSVHDFRFPMGGTFNRAHVDPSWFTSPPNSMRTNNINLGFDFTALPALPTQVAVKFRDLGGFENLSINGSPIIVGELASGSGFGLTWNVTEFPVAGGREGKLVINGPVHSLLIGGQEFWLDTLCVTARGDRGLDHFLVYDVDDEPLEAKVSLRGQFDHGRGNTALTRALTHFANPVKKNGEPILHNNAHLTWYRIAQQQQEPDRIVTVKNQFGRYRLKLGQPLFLLVPAEKKERESSFPTHLDHFKCYKADGDEIEKSVQLEDQFGRQRDVHIGRPRLFCVPVEKTHLDRVTPIRNKEGHLVVYEIRPREVQQAVKVEDQFGRHELKVLRSEMLCVPTQKLFTEGD